jgi:phosphatidate cytidylyltransferase
LEESQHRENHGRSRPAGRILAVRVAVGAVLIPVVLGITYLGGVPFALFIGLLAALGSYEFCQMAARAGWQPSRLVGIVGSACLAVAFNFRSGAFPGLVLGALLLVVLAERIVRSTKEQYLTSLSATFMGIIYTGWLLGFFVWLRNLPCGPGSLARAGAQACACSAFPAGRFECGTLLVYFVLVLTWSYDTFAYLVGSLVGRHKMFGRISPSKTTEGTLAGLCGCVAAALVARATFVPFITPAHAVVLGLLLGVAAQAGDLAESMIKRSTGAKDSSNLIPGHGGFLDRFDSLLFTGPVFYFYVRAFLCR